MQLLQVLVIASLALSAPFGQPEEVSAPPPLLVPAVKRPAIEVLLQRPVRELLYRFDDEGQLSYLRGENLTPACADRELLRETTTDIEARVLALARCSIAELAPLFAIDGEAARFSDLRLVSLRTGVDGPMIARFRQFVHGQPVKRTRLDLVVAGGELFSVRSRLERPSRLDLAGSPVDEVALESLIAGLPNLVGSPLLRSREFDARSGRWIAFVETEREILEVDEDSGTVLARRTATHPAAVTRLVKTASFGNGWNVNPDAPLLQQRNAVVNAFFFSGSPNICEARLDRWASVSVGEPRMTPHLASNNSVFQTYSAPVSCGTSLPPLLFDHPVTLDPIPADVRGIQAHVYFWNHDLAFFARSFEARLHAAYPFTTNPLGLYVNANHSSSPGFPCSEGPACFSTYGGAGRINLATNSDAVFSLETMAHEYGHFISYAYGYHEYSALSEGIAIALQLRYGRYRSAMKASRPHDSIYSSNYGKFSFDSGLFGAIDHRGSQRTWRGQRLPDYYNDDGNYVAYPESVKEALRAHLVYSETPPHPCATPNASSSIHACGSVVGSAYWTLVHNQTRVDYLYVSAGTTLTTPAAPFTSANLADLAFTYALQLISEPSGIVDFFDAVEERYINFRLNGVITSTEQLLVQIALGAHCLGSLGETCRTMHRLPDSALPSAFTTKVNYREAESGLRGGAAYLINNPGAVAADQHLYMVGPNADVCWNVNIGIGGTYKIHIAGYMSGPSTNKFDLYAPVGGWLPVTATPKAGWAWHRVDRYLNYGAQQICIRMPPNALTPQYLYIDAVAIGTDP